MNRTTLKQRKPKLFKALLGLDISCKKLNRNVMKMWAITAHKCPLCHKSITDPLEYDFMEANGECGTCDHVRSDAEVDMLSTASDVFSSMAEASGLTVDEYSEEMNLQ